MDPARERMIRRALAGAVLVLLLVVFALVLDMPFRFSRPQTRGGPPPIRGAGSAAVLSGSIGLYQLYVAEKDHPWTAERRSAVAERVERGLAFLVREAKPYGVRLQFVHRVRHVTYPGTIPGNMQEQLGWTEQAIAAAEGTSGALLARELKEELGVDQVALLVHVNKAAVSHAQGVGQHHQGSWGERAVCYLFSPEEPGPMRADTYAHELLHLFGADDLYAQPREDPARSELAAALFPRGVMLRGGPLEQLSVSSYTAWRIGWRPEIPANCELLGDHD